MPKTATRFYCDCRKLCHGVATLLPRTTYYKHKKYRQAPPSFQTTSSFPGFTALNENNVSRIQDSVTQSNARAVGQGQITDTQSEWQINIDLTSRNGIPQRMDQEANQTNEDCTFRDEEGTPGTSDAFTLGSQVMQDMGIGDELDEEELDEEEFSFERDQLDHLLDYDSDMDPSGMPDESSDTGDAAESSIAQSSLTVPPSDPRSVEDYIMNGEPRVPDLKTAVEFIRALRRSSLEDSGLTFSQIKQLRDPAPPEIFTNDTADLFSLKQYLATLNSSEETYRRVAENYNERHPEDSMLSLEDVKTSIPGWSGVFGVRHNMCINTCMAFTGPFKELERCSFCDSAQYHPQKRKEALRPLRQFYSIPLGPQIQALWKSPEMASRMMYRRERTEEIINELRRTGGIFNVYEDFLHGSEYLRAVQSGLIGSDDTLFMFGMDGAQLYRDKASDCWLFIIVLLELSPQERYLKKYVMAVSCVPGPNKPQQFDSFLFPTFQHISAVNNEGGLRIWNSKTKDLFTSRLFCFLGIADGPASTYFTGLVGHHGAYPCRLFCGIMGRNKPGGSCYYPVLLKPNNYEVEGSDHGDINIRCYRSSATHQYYSNLIYLLEAEHKTNYNKRRKVTGISKPALILGLSPSSRLPISGSLCGEAMHVTTLNLGDLLLPLWRGTLTCDKTDSISFWDWAVLRDARLWEEHGKDVERCRPYIPGSFDRAPRNIALKINTGYKAKEWQNYLFGLAPALLMEILPEIYWRNFCRLARAVQICTQHTISREDLLHAQELLDIFIVEFEDIYIQRRIDRMHFARPCLHAIWHLGLEVTRLGPSSLYASWVVERTIGNLGQEIRSDSRPYANLSERCLLRCQINALKAMFPGLEKEATLHLHRGAVDLSQGFFLLHPRDRYPSVVEEPFYDLLRSHLASHGTSTTSGITLKIVRWGRVLLPNGQVARSAWKEEQRTSPGRCSRNVKFHLRNEGTRFCEVIFYFLLNVNEDNLGFALVRKYSNYDQLIYDKSSRTVVCVKQEPTHDIIPIHALQSVVAANPWDKHDPGSLFIWEKPGLPLSMLQECIDDEQE